MNPHKQYQKVEVTITKDGKMSGALMNSVPAVWSADDQCYTTAPHNEISVETWDVYRWNEGVSVRAGVSDDGQRIMVETNMMGTVAHHTIDLQDESVRQALISAGWTPPDN